MLPIVDEMKLSLTQRTLLEFVRESEGRWTTRSIDFEYYGRSDKVIEPSVLEALREPRTPD